MQLKPGTRLRSTACTTEVVVVRAPKDEVEVTCGGRPMVDASSDAIEPAGVDPALSGGTLLGKRYADEDKGVELLCTKAGDGSLAVDGTVIDVKAAKPLPASD